MDQKDIPVVSRRVFNFSCKQSLSPMYSRSKTTKHSYLFQYKLSYRNKTGTNHHDYCLLQFDAIKNFF